MNNCKYKYLCYDFIHPPSDILCNIYTADYISIYIKVFAYIFFFTFMIEYARNLTIIKIVLSIQKD